MWCRSFHLFFKKRTKLLFFWWWISKEKTIFCLHLRMVMLVTLSQFVSLRCSSYTGSTGQTFLLPFSEWNALAPHSAWVGVALRGWGLGASGAGTVFWTGLLGLAWGRHFVTVRRDTHWWVFLNFLFELLFKKEIYWLDLLTHKNVFRDYFVHKYFFLMPINWFLSTNVGLSQYFSLQILFTKWPF